MLPMPTYFNMRTMDDSARRHALKRGLHPETLSTLAICAVPKDKSFDHYVERLSESDHSGLVIFTNQTRGQCTENRKFVCSV